MNEQGRQILQMPAEGKITADEAARLLDAVGRAEAPPSEPSSQLSEPSRRRVRYLRVLVDVPENFDGEGQAR